METKSKRTLNALIAWLLTLVVAFSMFTMPATVYAAGEGGEQTAGDGQATEEVSDASPVILGMTQLSPNAQELQTLRVNPGYDGLLYIDITAVGDDGSQTMLLHNKVWDPTEVTVNTESAGDAVAKVITVSLPGNATLAEYFAGDNPVASLQIAVGMKPVGDKVVKAAVYPVWASIQDSAERIFMGVRTDVNGTHAQKLGANPILYTFGEGDATYEHSLVTDCTFANGEYAVTYGLGQASTQAVQGRINYVDMVTGEIVDYKAISRLEDQTQYYDFARSFIKNDKYYRVIDNMNAKAPLSVANPSFTLMVQEVGDASDVSYVATIKYMQLNGEGEEPTFLWSDTLDAQVDAQTYNYSLPHSFSMANPQLGNADYDDPKYELYTISGLVDPAKSGIALVDDVLTITGSELVAIEPGDDGIRRLEVEVGYAPSSLTNEATFTIREINAQTGDWLFGDEASSTKVFEVTPYSAEESYSPAEVVLDERLNGKFTPWQGNQDTIGVSWQNLNALNGIASETGYVRNVYYIPEGYQLEPYDVTLKYVNILTGSTLKTVATQISPDSTSYTALNSEGEFSLDGDRYVRLGGQEEPIWHAYPTAAREYTVYYRNVNDTLNANTVIRRTQIIDTYRYEVVPGTALAAPVAVDADGTADTGILPGDGTVIVNDDENPLANLAGEDTATERILEDENPLASGWGTVFGWPTLLGIGLGVILAALCARFYFVRKRKKESDSTTQANA